MVGIRPTQFQNEKAPHIQTEELVEACKWLKATGFPQYVQESISKIRWLIDERGRLSSVLFYRRGYRMNPRWRNTLSCIKMERFRLTWKWQSRIMIF